MRWRSGTDLSQLGAEKHEKQCLKAHMLTVRAVNTDRCSSRSAPIYLILADLRLLGLDLDHLRCPPELDLPWTVDIRTQRPANTHRLPLMYNNKRDTQNDADE